MYFRRGGFLAAIFDCDGVLIDTASLHFTAWEKMLEEFGINLSFSDYKNKIDGLPCIAGARAILGDLSPAELEKACDIKQTHLTNLLEMQGVEAFKDAPAFIKKLRGGGIKVALVSSSKNAFYIIQKLGLDSLFDTTVLEESGIRPKPNSDIFLEAAFRLGVHPSACAVFEDTKLGVEAAKEAGMICVGIHRGINPEAVESADVTICDFSELSTEHLEELFGRDSPCMSDLLPSAQNDDWFIMEPDFDAKNQGISESILALGNGYLGRRAALEEFPPGCRPGTYIAGLFDRAQAQVTQLVNIPNPVHLRIRVGEMDLALKNRTEHSRALDMQHGVLSRKTVFTTKVNGRIDYRSATFLSMQYKNIGVVRIALTPLDKAVVFTVKDRIDGSVVNHDATQKKDIVHIDVADVGESEGICYLAAETKDRKIPIVVASHLGAVFDCKTDTSGVIETTYRVHAKKITRELKIKLDKGQTVHLMKVFYIRHFASGAKLETVRKQVIAIVRKAVARRYENLLAGHIKAWEEKWQAADIEISGDPAAQKAVRFNVYQLLICANANDSTSIGAKALTGEGYSGHIFWETEIYLQPFFLYTDPGIVRNLLMYRCRRLDQARKKAKDCGFKGALFPWESADTGEEVTPSWAKGNFGRIIRILTGEQQHHIVSDIAYAVMNYWRATRDKTFMKRYGLELVFETARFWQSRVVYNKTLDRYEIRQVIGPDEFHESVHNSAYINIMAAWNLKFARDLFMEFNKTAAETIEHLRRDFYLTEDEVSEWGTIGDKLYVSRNGMLLEAHDGYFKREEIDIEKTTHGFPIFPREIPRGTRLQKTQLIKQADVVLLLHLLTNLFSMDEIKANLDYYEKRTLHQSSLSCPIYSLVASEIGDAQVAYRYFRHASLVDLANIHGSNSGIHIGACGGTWQALIFGFAGLRIRGDKFLFEPCLPEHWSGMAFKINWRGSLFYCKITRQGQSIEIIKLKGS